MKIFLNLISVTEGGQIIRASKFIEKIENDSSKIELVIVKQVSVLSNLKNSSKIKIINIYLGNHFSVLKRFFWENFLMHKLIRINSCNIF